jgi:hypothetical protein
MPRNRLPRLIKTTPHKAERTKEDLWRDFWKRETVTGQQVAKYLDCYMMTMKCLGFLNTFNVANSCILLNYSSNRRSRVSSGSIVSDYGLDDRAIEVRSPAGANDFSSNLCVQTGSEVHPASCTMGTGGKSAAGAWRWPLTPI